MFSFSLGSIKSRKHVNIAKLYKSKTRLQHKGYVEIEPSQLGSLGGVLQLTFMDDRWAVSHSPIYTSTFHFKQI